MVTIQSLAAELLRHGSGAAVGPAAAVGSADESPSTTRVVVVGMVFQVLSHQAAGQGSSSVTSSAAADAASRACGGSQPSALKQPAVVENPDGSLQVLLPKGAVSDAKGAAARSRRPIAVDSSDLEHLPYADYELPELTPVPELAPLPGLGSVGLDLAPYIANGGNEPAPVAIPGMDPEAEAEVEEADEALVRHCDELDREVVRRLEMGDKAVAAVIEEGERRTRG